MSWVLVSASCPSCVSVKCALPTLQTRGFRIIALDQPMSSCVRDLLWALQVTSLPAIQHDGVLRCGNDAVLWLACELPGDCDMASVNTLGTTISELETLHLLTQSDRNTNYVSQDPNKLLSILRSAKIRAQASGLKPNAE